MRLLRFFRVVVGGGGMQGPAEKHAGLSCPEFTGSHLLIQ